MDPGRVASAGLRLLRAFGPSGAENLLTPGRVLQATVLTAGPDRAVLLLAQGMRLEVALRTPLRQGARIRVQVEPEVEQVRESGRVILLKLLEVEEPAKPEEPVSENPAAAPWVTWIPVGEPEGRQGWVQLAVPREPPEHRSVAAAVRETEIRLWWETPALGPVAVTLAGTGSSLAVQFHVGNPDSLQRLAAGLPDLEAALREKGFVHPRLACHPLKDGEGPVGDPGRALDRRL